MYELDLAMDEVIALIPPFQIQMRGLMELAGMSGTSRLDDLRDDPFLSGVRELDATLWPSWEEPPTPVQHFLLLEPLASEHLFRCFRQARRDLLAHMRSRHDRRAYPFSSHPEVAMEHLAKRNLDRGWQIFSVSRVAN